MVATLFDGTVWGTLVGFGASGVATSEQRPRNNEVK
jgi:hypothetical protein